MSLDTYQKRGSAMMLSLPFRPWIFVPDGTIDETDRQAAEFYSTAIAFAEPAPAVNSEPITWRRRNRR